MARITMKQVDAKIEHLNYLSSNVNGKFAVQNGGTYYRLIFNRHRGGEPLPVSPAVKSIEEFGDIVDTMITVLLINWQNGWE